MHHQYLLRTSLNTLCTAQIQGIDDTHNSSVDVQCQLIKHNTQDELHMYKYICRAYVLTYSCIWLHADIYKDIRIYLTVVGIYKYTLHTSKFTFIAEVMGKFTNCEILKLFMFVDHKTSKSSSSPTWTVKL